MAPFLCVSRSTLGRSFLFEHFHQIPEQPIRHHESQQKYHEPKTYGQYGQKGKKSQILIEFKHFL
jgi:hypothetical protein